MNNRKFHIILILIGLSISVVSCRLVIYYTHPTKQNTKDKTKIPKKPNFTYNNLLMDSSKYFFEKQLAFTLIDSSYVYYNYPVKQSYVFWTDGKCYYMGDYKLENLFFNEENFYGFSGYYYLTKDTLFVELFKGNGHGFGYYYNQYQILDNKTLICDANKWFYREPKHDKKHKLEPDEIEKESMRLHFHIDTITTFEINPKW